MSEYMSEYIVKLFPNDEKKIPVLKERTELLALLESIIPSNLITEKLLN